MAYSGTTAAILSNYDEALKTFYLDAVREQLNHNTLLADVIDTNEKDVSGKNATINHHYGRTKGTGVRKDGGQLPAADYQKFKTSIVPMRYNYGRITISGPTIAATRDSKGAYARAVETEVSGGVNDLQREINRQLWGIGYGILARWRTGTSTSMTLQRLYRGNSAGGDGFGSAFGAKYVDESQDGTAALVVSIPTSIGSSGIITVSTSDLIVTAVVETANLGYDTITLTDPSLSEAAGTYWVRPGNSITTTISGTGSDGSYGRDEMMGLRGIITDQNIDDIAVFDGSSTGLYGTDGLQGLAVGSYNWWKANVKTATGTRYEAQSALTLIRMQTMFDLVEKKAGVGYGPDMILTTRAIRREYLELVSADRRRVNTMELDGGWKGLDYNDIPLMVDNDAIDGEMYFITSKDLQIYRMADYDWMTKDGSILHLITDYDAYEAVLFRYAELGCSRRNSHGVLCDIAYVDDAA
jgi:hypothetical protein